MTSQRQDQTRTFAAEGEVVEIFEDAGERRAKVVLRPGTVVDVAATGVPELHLGERVVFDGVITIGHMRSTSDVAAAGEP
jgi:hypothetical protein